MTLVYAKHEPYWDTGHLGEVISEMTIVGRPTIRAARIGDDIFAVEGSHRICAAHYLGITPMIVVLPDGGPGADMFFASVRDRLPEYDFDHVLVLDLSAFL